MAQRVVVMYAGRKVEEAPVREIFARPLHPYTRGLIGAVPLLGSSLREGGRGKLAEIPGLVPSLRRPIVGCAFAGRCSMVTDLCRRVAPAIEIKAPEHSVACHYAERRMAA
jgi:peptide/nickel transport system ATP-binding protein